MALLPCIQRLSLRFGGIQFRERIWEREKLVRAFPLSFRADKLSALPREQALSLAEAVNLWKTRLHESKAFDSFYRGRVCGSLDDRFSHSRRLAQERLRADAKKAEAQHLLGCILSASGPETRAASAG